jgi:hypothetical protein
LIEGAKGETDEELDREVDEAFTHLGKMTTIPSDGPTGILLKLRGAWSDIGWLDTKPIEDLSLLEQLVHSALRDAEQLAEGGAR